MATKTTTDAAADITLELVDDIGLELLGVRGIAQLIQESGDLGASKAAAIAIEKIVVRQIERLERGFQDAVRLAAGTQS